MEHDKNYAGDGKATSTGNEMKKPEPRKNYSSRDALAGGELWTDGLICAFEFVRGPKFPVQSKSGSRIPSRPQTDDGRSRFRVPSNGFAERLSSRTDRNKISENLSINELGDRAAHLDENRDSQAHQPSQFQSLEKFEGSHWIPIGWARISELVQNVQVDSNWTSQQFEFGDDEDDLTVADLATPYWERPAGPVWWCHLSAGHPFVESWLSSAQWLHPAVSLALRNESRLISDRMKHLLYEVYCF